MDLVSELKGDLCVVTNALQKIKRNKVGTKETKETKDTKDIKENSPEDDVDN